MSSIAGKPVEIAAMFTGSTEIAVCSYARRLRCVPNFPLAPSRKSVSALAGTHRVAAAIRGAVALSALHPIATELVLAVCRFVPKTAVSGCSEEHKRAFGLSVTVNEA